MNIEQQDNKNNKPKLLIHIGYHKTGTTYWQKNIFSASKVNFIDRGSVRANLLTPTPYEFEAENLNQWLESRLTVDQLNVISEEELSGNIHTSGNGRSITFETIERLSKIEVAEVFILIFIRNQIQIIDSSYRQYIKRGGCFSFNHYIYSKDKGSERHRFPGFSLDHFKYDDVIKHCYKNFGKQKVIIGAYENFFSSSQTFLKDLSTKLESQLVINDKKETQQVNKSLSNLSILLSRFSNRFFGNEPISRNSILSLNFLKPYWYRFYLFLDRILPQKMIFKTYVNSEAKQMLEQYYSLSNQTTQELTGIDLEQLNYPMKTPVNDEPIK